MESVLLQRAYRVLRANGINPQDSYDLQIQHASRKSWDMLCLVILIRGFNAVRFETKSTIVNPIMVVPYEITEVPDLDRMISSEIESLLTTLGE